MKHTFQYGDPIEIKWAGDYVWGKFVRYLSETKVQIKIDDDWLDEPREFDVNQIVSDPP